MGAVLTTAVVVCALAIGALVYAVRQLRREVDALSRELSAVVADRAATSAPRLAGDQTAAGPVPVTGAHVAPDTDAKTQNRPNAAVDPNPAVGPDLTVDPDPVAIITEMARTESDDADLSVSRVASVTLAGPLIKVAALSHGLRRALDEESRMRIGYAVRKELKRQRKMRRRRRSGRAPSKGWTS